MVKVLLDTNVIIYRETNRILNENTPDLFKWLDRLHYDKYIHPISIQEISGYADIELRNTILTKLEAYNTLSTLAPFDETMNSMLLNDFDINSQNDTKILNELYCGRVDFLITQDKGIYQKAKLLGLAGKVYSIESFAAQMLAENPQLINYSVLSVYKRKIGSLDFNSSFFDSLRDSYKGFDQWLNKKFEDDAYVCFLQDELKAFLYLKKEDETEVYSDIMPIFAPKRRLKIGTFKVSMNGLKLGERFLKIALENAIRLKVEEIYVTIFDDNPNDLPKQSLVMQLKSFGFYRWGTKSTGEGVYVKDMKPHFNSENPKLSFPFYKRNSDTYFCPIWPDYHTSLFPDSILNNESPDDYRENEPYRNAISKVYISRSIRKDLKCGDNIIFYRTGGLHVGVITTIGVVHKVYFPKNIDEFKDICRRKSIFSNEKLEEFWHRKLSNGMWCPPFVVEFLYTYSLPKPKINLERLIKEGIISDFNNVPRGFMLLSHDKVNKILEISRADESFIVN
mgnify:FL=1